MKYPNYNCRRLLKFATPSTPQVHWPASPHAVYSFLPTTVSSSQPNSIPTEKCPSSFLHFHHQLILMSAGLSARGSNKWHTTRIATGKMQENSAIRQLYGANAAMYTITPILSKQMKNVPLNFLRIRTTSLPKTTSSASFAVAPHDMSISNA